MGRCYSKAVSKRHPSLHLSGLHRPALPRVWLLSDARNDDVLDHVLRRLPKGSGFVFRHYHLPPAQRRARFKALRRLCISRGIRVVLAGSARQAKAWGAEGAYGAGQHLGTAHSLRELRRLGPRTEAVLLSPVHATRSHPGAPCLGPVRFLLLAKASPVPVIALGGMNRKRARRLPAYGWAAIDGLSAP